MLKRLIRSLTRRVGYDIVPYDVAGDARARRQRLLESARIGCVLDVGANQGEYGLILRDAGYDGPIVSFEPLSTAFALLQQRAILDGNWEAHPFALGDADGSARLQVAGNSYSSSLLGMLPRHASLAPDAGYVGEEQVDVRRLDGVWDGLRDVGARCWLKVDTQGFELAVLRGAGERLADCPAVELEVSFVPLYEGQPLFEEVHAFMTGRGYRPVSFETGPGQVVPSTGETLQVDVVYLRD